MSRRAEDAKAQPLFILVACSYDSGVCLTVI